jgi:beta-N-acetylhexosaminidase
MAQHFNYQQDYRSSTRSNHDFLKTPLPLIVLDVEAFELTQQDIRRISDPLVAGVILFSRNFKTRQQLMHLTQDIKKHAPNAVIFVDHEGGRVQRFKTDGFSHLAAMYRLNEIYQTKPALAGDLAQYMGFILATELVVCGVDMSYTPVLDLYHCNEENQVLSKVIGDRAFAKTGLDTMILANRLIAGLKEAGMSSCGKHFPGHGYASEDSHFDIARDSRSLTEIMREDVFPYQALGNTIDSIMPAHVIYEQVDPDPAGFSVFWLQNILRKMLNYKGYIFSDDLSMEGASIVGERVIDRAKKALLAGCDGVIICNRPDLSDELLEGLGHEILQNGINHVCAHQIDDLQADITDTQTILNIIKQRHVRLFAQSRFKTYDWEAMQQDAQYIHAKNTLKTYGLILNG